MKRKLALRVLIGLIIFLLGLSIRWYFQTGWPTSAVFVYIASALHWKYLEKMKDWERSAAYSTLAFLPFQYLVFVGTSGPLSGAQLIEALLVGLFFKAAAVYDERTNILT